MTCQQELMALGKPYSRTCEDCGLFGPCKNTVNSKAMSFPKPSLWLAIAKDGRVKYTTDSDRAQAWKDSGSYRLVRDYYTEPPKTHLINALENAVRSLEWAAMIIQDIPPKSEFMETLREAKALLEKERT